MNELTILHLLKIFFSCIDFYHRCFCCCHLEQKFAIFNLSSHHGLTTTIPEPKYPSILLITLMKQLVIKQLVIISIAYILLSSLTHQFKFFNISLKELKSSLVASLYIVKVKVTKSCSTLATLYSPWNSPGQNTGVGSLSLLQGIFPTQGLNPGPRIANRLFYQLSHQGSPRILKWVAYPFFSRSS